VGAVAGASGSAGGSVTISTPGARGAGATARIGSLGGGGSLHRLGRKRSTRTVVTIPSANAISQIPASVLFEMVTPRTIFTRRLGGT
jgi:hypothetical protein